MDDLDQAISVSDDSTVLLAQHKTEELEEESQHINHGQGCCARCRHSRVFTIIKNSWITQEGLSVLRFAVPIILTLFFQQLLFLISLAYVGHISGQALELDAAALAYSFVNVTGILVGLGLATAGDTLCSQTYGLKDYKMIGVVLQRGILILGVAMFPIWTLWLNTEWILVLLQQPPCVARLATQYVYVFCLALPSIFLYTMLQKYLQAQGIVWPFTVVGLLANIISAIAHGILIFPAELGFIGSPISMVLANCSAPLLLLAYVWLRRLHRESWGGWSWESLRGWGQFAKLGVPGLLMIAFEWCSIEISAFVSGSIDEIQLGINSIIIALLNVLYMVPLGLCMREGLGTRLTFLPHPQVPLGLSIAVTIRVGNELGAGNPRRAKRSAYVTTGITLCNALVTSIILWSTKNKIGTLFTKDKEVIEGVSVVMNVIAVMVFSDGVQACIGGILRGSGRQVLGAVVNLIAYYVIGLPVAVVLALVAEMGTLGIWIGLAGANMLQAVTYLVALCMTDWERQSQRAQNDLRVGKKEEVVTTSAGGSEEVEMEDKGIELENDSTNSNEDTVQLTQTDQSNHRDPATPTFTRLKLFAYRSSFFLVGVVVLVVGGVLSRFLPSFLDNTTYNCTTTNTTSEIMNQTTYI